MAQGSLLMEKIHKTDELRDIVKVWVGSGMEPQANVTAIGAANLVAILSADMTK